MILVFALGISACSRADLREFAEDTRVRAENVGAAARPDQIAYPVSNEGEGVMTPVTPPNSKVSSSKEGAAPADEANTGSPTILFYNVD